MCPGGIFCGEELHWTLIFFELLAPYLIGLFLLPLVVKARIKDVYGHTKKELVVERKDPKKVSFEG